MKWYHNLYVGDSIADRVKQVKRKLNHHVWIASIYVIAFASNPKNLLDVIPCWELRQRAYPGKNLFIVGLAKGYKEALELVTRIVDETYQNTGNVDVRTYLLSERRKEA